MPTELTNRRVTVMGLGRFGGGTGLVRFLADQRARVHVTDLSPADQLTEPLAEIDDLVRAGAVTLRLGSHEEHDFTPAGADLVVANPAVPKPWTNRYLLAAGNAGVPVTTEIGLLIERLPSREMVVGITGSVGKSTTTAMIAHALGGGGSAGHVIMGGNIGGTLLNDLPTITPDTRVVLELSSAMLHWIGSSLRWSPRVAVVTNLMPNHLDWHGDAGHYAASKQQLILHQRPGDAAILGASVADWGKLTPARPTIVTDPLPSLARGGPRLSVPGSHNRLNAAMALAACEAFAPEFPRAGLLSRLSTFPGLPHRLQLALDHDGRRYYNDSKCTTPDALMQALSALTEETPGDYSRLHVIVGGYDKKVSLASVAALAIGDAHTRPVAGLYCVGVTGPAISGQARALGPTAAARAFDCGDLAGAVRTAMPRMKPGDALLLSPACASWDQFPNYEHRGRLFIDLVHDAAGVARPEGTQA